MSRLFDSSLVGSNQNAITVANGTENNTLAAWTVMAWVYPQNYGGNGQGTRAYHSGTVCVKDPQTAYNMFLGFENGFDGVTNIVSAITGANSCATQEAVSVGPDNCVVLNQWQHLAASFDSAGDSKVHLYVNGLEVSSYKRQQAGIGAVVDDHSSSFYIGNDSPGTGFDDGFGGYIADCRTWTKQLTQAEIQSAMNYGNPQPSFVGENLSLQGNASPEPNLGVGAAGVLSSPNAPVGSPGVNPPGSSPMSIGVWQPQGIVVAPLSADDPGQPNVLHEAGAVILSGTVFKMWFGTKNGICYAESTNGTSWTRYSGNPIISITGGTTNTGFPTLWKNGSTYYLYINTTGSTSVSVWTSTDGVTFTQQNATALKLDQGWESQLVSQLGVAGKVGATWYGYYTSFDAGLGNYAIGQATSTDLIHWVKNPANPVLTQYAPSNLAFMSVGGAVYGWTQIVLPTIPTASASCPSDITRYSAGSAAGPFIPLTAGGSLLSTYYRNAAIDGVGLAAGQAADPSLVYDGTNVWMFYTATANGPGTIANYQIAAAKAPNMSFAQLVAGNEGVVNVPAPTTAILNQQLTTLGSDNFQRANANPIGGNWTRLFSDFGTAQLASHLFEASVAGTNSDSYWNAITWPNDQWTSMTIHAAVDVNSYNVEFLRGTPGTFAAGTVYRFFAQGPLGTPTAACEVVAYVAGTPTVIIRFDGNAGSIQATFNINDVVTIVVIGTQLSVYQNGNLLGTVSDSSVTSGDAGIGAAPSVAAGVTGSSISAWAGGGIGTLPNPPAPSRANVSTYNPNLCSSHRS